MLGIGRCKTKTPHYRDKIMCIARLTPGQSLRLGDAIEIVLIAATNGLATLEVCRHPLPGDGTSRINVTVEGVEQPLVSPPIAGPEAVGD